MALTTVTKVRLLTNLSTTDISDIEISNLISEATKEVIPKISVRVIRERIEHIDNVRKNKKDSSNTTFYVKNWSGKFLADRNTDGSVRTDDLIVYQVTTDGTETELTVSSIDHDLGKFVLSSAPASNVELYVTYNWSYFDQKTPDNRVQLTTTFLTCAYAYAKINVGRAPKVRFGSLDLSRHMDSFKHYYDLYLNQLSQLNSIMGAWKEGKTNIDSPPSLPAKASWQFADRRF